jgi:hypothetical protein
LPIPYLKGAGAIDSENGSPEKGMSWGFPRVISRKASNKGSWSESEPEVEGGVRI